MKRGLLLVVGCWLMVEVRGQSDFRFADSTAQWNVLLSQFLMAGPNDYRYDTEIYAVASDTTFNNYSYQKITHSFEGNAFIRIDSTEKVFAYNTYDSLDYLLYDFSKLKGDTFTLYFDKWDHGIFCQIDSIDTVVVSYSRKRIFVSYYEWSQRFQDIWIEGIGSTLSHFLKPGAQYRCCDMPGYLLLCYYEQNTLLHHDTIFTDCIVDSTIIGISELKLDYLKIFPNPTTTSHNIQLSQTPSSSTAFQLFDITGRMILEKPLTETSSQIDLNGVSKGMYLYNVVSGKEKAGGGKLVVE